MVFLYNLYAINKFSDEINNERNNASEYFLDTMALTFDSVFSDVALLKQDIERNERLYKLTEYSFLNEQARLDAAQFTDYFGETNTKHKFVLGCYVYFPKIDLITTTEEFYESENFFRLNVKDYESHYPAWKNTQWQSVLYTEKTMKIGKNSESYQVIDISYPLYKRGSELMCVVSVLVDKETLFSKAKKMPFYDDSFFLILNRKGDVLISSEPDYPIKNFRDYVLDNDKKPALIESGDKKMVMYTIRSFGSNYRYVYLIHESLWKLNLTKLFVRLFAMNIACLAFILAIVVMLSRWNYKKLQTILGELGGTTDISQDGNEYQLIKKRISHYKQQRFLLEHSLEKQMTVVRNSFLNDWLKGYVHEELEESLKSYDITFDHPNFLVVALYIADFGEFDDGSKRDAAFVINNFLQDVRKEGEFIFVELEGLVVYIINYDFKDKNIKSFIKKSLGEVNSLCKKYFGLRFIGGVSSVKESWELIPQLYIESMRSLERCKFYEVDDFVYYSEIHAEDGSLSLYDYPESVNNELMIHIKEGDCEKATERIRCIFDKFIFSTNTSKWSSDGLIHIILYNIMDLGISFSDDVAEKINKLNSISSIKDSVDLLCEIVSDICKENSDLDNKSNELYNTIKQYIDENYTQVGMNVFEVGEKYGMSSYYLSRMFKNHSGIKLGTYINGCAIIPL